MGYPCIGLEMEYAVDAFDHFSGNLEVVQDYGWSCGNNLLHAWDEGGRVLFRCKACGGYVLKQSSEFHGFSGDDDLYTDYFPMSGPEEAEELNRTLDGTVIEREFEGNYIIRNHRQGYVGWWKPKKHDWGKPLEGEAKELLESLATLNGAGPAPSAADLKDVRSALEVHAPYPEADTVNGRCDGSAGLAIDVFLRECMGDPGSVRREVWELLSDYVVEVDAVATGSVTRRAGMIVWLLPDIGLLESYIDHFERRHAKPYGKPPFVSHLIPALLLNRISKGERGWRCATRLLASLPNDDQRIAVLCSALSADELESLVSIRGLEGKSLLESDSEWFSEMKMLKPIALRLFERFPHDDQDVVERLKDYRRCQDVISTALVCGRGELLQEDLDWIDGIWDENWPDIPDGIIVRLIETSIDRNREKARYGSTRPHKGV